MVFSLATVAFTAASILSSITTVEAQVSLQQAQYQGCYSSSYPMYTNSSLTYQFQTSGWCQQQCGAYAEQAAFALAKGSECYCGNKLPPNSTKVDDSQCNRPCQGYGQEMCGGMSTYSVYTSGLTSTVEIASNAEASSAATSGASSTTGASQTATQVQSTVTQAGQTVVVTASSAATAKTTQKSGSKGASKAGIAAGVVVGLVALAAIVGGAYFFMRHRKRRAIEEEHQRQQTINGFAKGSGTLKSEHSTADSRLDPTVMYRRQSSGSIADERDLSRRVLKVTNPDRNTMIA